MRRNRPDLIVPIRDRRARRRILTLKNFRNACFVLVAIFAAITIYANLRGRKPLEDFGRLYSPRIESPSSLPKHPQVAPTDAIADQDAADPTLVDAMNRAMILRDGGQAPTPVQAGITPAPTTGEAPVPHDTSNVVMVGGPEGVTLVKRDPHPRPVLGGGFGR
ncbi:MAG TPA: hypothetical protein VLU46_11005 [Thermoanaerobaculia bacterium]|nr:hypothetical protein [Thermoanaerobaculia bacterium]